MRPIALILLIVCVIGLSVSATFLIGHTIYKKLSDDQSLAVQKNNQLLSDKNAELQYSLQKLEDKYSNLESRFKDLSASIVLSQHSASRSTSPPGPPPVEQPLVREGEFAVELATAFNLTSSRDEATAESYVASINIAPRNGWISDYPITPDIITEIRESVAASASSEYLQISETDALDLMDNICIAMNLPVKGVYASSYESRSVESPPEASEYVAPSVVEDYYDDYKPPVITYYPPPVEYVYLYNWVPAPFWWGGYSFGGFFILIDFDRHYRRHPVTNRVTNANGTVNRIDATTRAGVARNREIGATPNISNTAEASVSRTPASSAAPPLDDTRDSVSSRPDAKNLTSGPRSDAEAASRPPSHDGRTFNGTPSRRSSPGIEYRSGTQTGSRGISRSGGLAGEGHR
jgi:hypothetical protein